MPRRVQGPDGAIHEFPDDATDDEIGEALAINGTAADRSGLPVPPDPRGFESFADDPLIMGSEQWQGRSSTRQATDLGVMLLGGRLLSKVPWGRLLTAGKGAAMETPLIGKPLKGGAKAWSASRPSAPAPPAGPSPGTTGTAFRPTGPVPQAQPWSVPRPAAAPPTAPPAATPKPKLSAQEFQAAHQREYGAEASARLRSRGGDVSRGEQAEAIRAATGTRGQLPEQAKRAMERKLASMTPDEAFAYAAKAPNAPAQSYFGDLLRKALEERLKR